MGLQINRAIVNHMTNKGLNRTKNNYVTDDDDGNCFELSYPEKSIYNYPNEQFTAVISSISPIRIGSLFKYKYVTH